MLLSRGRSVERAPVISQAGTRDTYLVGGFRMLSAATTGGAFVFVGRMLDGHNDLEYALLCALFAAGFAFLYLSRGGRAARNEERRLRHTILARQFATTDEARSADNQFPAARVIQLLTDNTERLTEFRQAYLGSTLAAFLIPVLTLAYIGFFIDPVVGFTVLLLTPVIPLAVRGFTKFFRKTSSRSRRQRETLSSRYLDAIRNLITVRLLGAGPRIEHELRVEGEKNRAAIMRLLAGNQLVILVMDGAFSLVLICLTAALTIWRAESLTPGDVVVIMLLTVLTLEPLQQVAGFFYIGMGGIASQKAIRTYLVSATGGATATTTDSTEGVTAVHSGRTNRETEEDLPAINLADVTFDYGRGAVLHGIDLNIASGSRVAIVGPSGAGKSTLFGLLRGSLAPQGGLITLAGNVATAENLIATREYSAVVSQTTWLFTGTIADNLRVAKPDATVEELWDALRTAHVAEEVARMPRGLDTELGESAALISGGQAQRLSLARALLSGRQILLLDEPTSQVDIESEAHIIDAIESLPRDRTVLMITHRHSLLRIADHSFELNDGTLVALEVANV